MLVHSRFAIASLLLLGIASSALADQAVIGPSKDNTLYQATFGGDLSNGAGAYVFVGTTLRPPPDGDIRRIVIQFDIAAAVPAGSTINSVALLMNMSKTVSGPQPVTLHPLLRDWGEGASIAPGEQGGGAPAQPGDATWRHTFFDQEFWQNPGGDFSATVTAETAVVGNGPYTWASTPQMVADLQQWLDDPATNFGWLLRAPEALPATAKRFDSREHPTPANRPTLTIDFTPPPDCNNNGVPDSIDLANGASLDCNENAVPDECETDSDADGLIDDCDGCPNDPNKTDPGPCGCGEPETDTDGDGTPDCIDACPDDPNKTDPGMFGCGVPEVDSDQDGVPDSNDRCPGENDNTDTDSDGIPDCLDNCPLEPNPDQQDADENGIGDACEISEQPEPASAPDPNEPDETGDENEQSEQDPPPEDMPMTAECGDALCGWGMMPMMTLSLFGWGWIKVQPRVRRSRR